MMDHNNERDEIRSDFAVVREEEPVSLIEWLFTLIITLIPVVGIFALILWAFGKGASESKRNWAKAILVLLLICSVISGIFMGTIFTAISSLFLEAV